MRLLFLRKIHVTLKKTSLSSHEREGNNTSFSLHLLYETLHHDVTERDAENKSLLKIGTSLGVNI